MKHGHTFDIEHYIISQLLKKIMHQAIIETDVVEEEEKDKVTKLGMFKSYVKYTWSLY